MTCNWLTDWLAGWIDGLAQLRECWILLPVKWESRSELCCHHRHCISEDLRWMMYSTGVGIKLSSSPWEHPTSYFGFSLLLSLFFVFCWLVMIGSAVLIFNSAQNKKHKKGSRERWTDLKLSHDSPFSNSGSWNISLLSAQILRDDSLF